MPDTEELKQVEEKTLRLMIREAAQSAAPVFWQRQWRWANAGFDLANVPSAARIEACLTRLVDSAREKGGEACISSGRFTVARWEEDGEEYFDISLQLSEAVPDA
jgi:hypothetical protein